MDLTGQTLRFVSIFIIFAISIATAKDTCPPEVVLHPCVCDQHLMVMDIKCSNIASMETLVNVFEQSGDMRFKNFLLDHSSLMYLPVTSLQSKRIKGLYLLKVSMISLFDKVPSAVNELETLSMEEAFLQRGVRWDLLENLSKLVSLHVANMNVKSLGRSFVRYVGNKKILFLSLTENKIKHLDDHVFANLKELNFLSLANNKIKILKRSMFPKPAVISQLELHMNEIEALPEDIFSDMPFLNYVWLKHNRISKFTEPIFGGIFNQLNVLQLENNPITCDCSIQWSLSLERGRVYGTCAKTIDKKGRLISDITTADLDYCHQSK